MEIKTAAGRVLLAGFEQSKLDDSLARLLKDVSPAGAIFFQRNIIGIEEFTELSREVRETLARLLPPGHAPILAIDMEGGTVDRFRHILAPLPSARAVAATNDDPFTRRFGALIGEALAGFRLNVDFAPVLDLGLPVSEPVLGTRTAGSDPKRVVRFARNFLAGLSRYDIQGCGKHFPGLGGGSLDTHKEMAPVERTAEELEAEDLAPFRDLHDELPLMMVNHAWYPALHPAGTAPQAASLSRDVVTALLREKIGFKGVIVCDDLEMGGALAGRSIGESAVAAIEAGCHLLPVCHKEENVRAVHQALVERANADAAFAERLAEAALRIEVLLQSLHHTATEGGAHHQVEWDRLKEAIQDLHESTDHMGALAAEAPPYREGPPRKERAAGSEGGGHGGRGRGPRRDRDGGERPRGGRDRGREGGRGRREEGGHREHGDRPRGGGRDRPRRPRE